MKKKFIVLSSIVLATLFCPLTVVCDNVAEAKSAHNKIYVDTTDCFSQAMDKYNSNEYQEAINLFDKAIDMAPNSAESYYFRAISKARLEKYEAAIEDFNKAILLKSDNPKAYYNRGFAKFRLGQYEKAIKDYDMAIKNNPKEEAYYSNRGLARFKLKQYRKAIADVNQAVELSPSSSKNFLVRALIYMDNHKFDLAVEDCKKAVQLNPDSYLTNYMLGISYLKNGKNDQGYMALNRAIELLANNQKQIPAELYDNITKPKDVLKSYMEQKVLENKNEESKYSNISKDSLVIIKSDINELIEKNESILRSLVTDEHVKLDGDFGNTGVSVQLATATLATVAMTTLNNIRGVTSI